ncbi:hypothetical protein BDV97DRAFT_401580 [Delphinella strobiligena]|nr:hypothetical protein BDV97DRAFT_401580 [Delphinella strobiligena]
MSPPDFFCALPNELISRIAHIVDQADLPAFRSVSKLIHGNSNNRFATEFIDDVPVIMSRKSLNALAGIAAHEVFGPYVKSITFNPVQLVEKTRLAPWLDDNSPDRHRFLDLIEEQTALKRSGDALRLFTQALDSIEKYGHGIRFDLDEFETSAIGFTALWDVSWYSRQWAMIRNSTFKMMVTAAINSRCKVRALELYLGPSGVLHHRFYYENTLSVRYLDRVSLKHVCSNLLALGFTFHHQPHPMAITSDAMVEMLEFSNRVETIDFAFGLVSWEENTWDLFNLSPYIVFTKCAMALSTSSLSTLRLSGLVAREQDCLRLLTKARASLQSLKLSLEL